MLNHQKVDYNVVCLSRNDLENKWHDYLFSTYISCQYPKKFAHPGDRYLLIKLNQEQRIMPSKTSLLDKTK